MAGVFLAVEGVDGAGKSTLVKGLGDEARSRGLVVQIVQTYSLLSHAEEIAHFVGDAYEGFMTSLRENGPALSPTQWPLFLRGHGFLRAELDYMLGVEKHLASGCLVLADRFALTHYVRARLSGEKEALCLAALAQIPVPDATIYLGGPASLAFKRVQQRDSNELKPIVVEGLSFATPAEYESAFKAAARYYEEAIEKSNYRNVVQWRMEREQSHLISLGIELIETIWAQKAQLPARHPRIQ